MPAMPQGEVNDYCTLRFYLPIAKGRNVVVQAEPKAAGMPLLLLLQL